MASAHEQPQLLRGTDHPDRLPRGTRDTNAGCVPGRWVLAGLRAYELSGRTRLPTAHCFPANRPVPPWGLFSPTAAGQPRLLNRVPIFSLCECAGTNTPTPIGGLHGAGQHNILGYRADFA